MNYHELASQLSDFGETSLAESVAEEGIESYAESPTDLAVLRNIYRRRLRNPRLQPGIRSAVEKCLDALNHLSAESVPMAHIRLRNGSGVIVIFDDVGKAVIGVFPASQY